MVRRSMLVQLVAFVMILCISMSFLLPFSFRRGGSLPAREEKQEMQHIRQTKASDVQDEQSTQMQQQINEIWKRLHVDQIHPTRLQQVPQTHEQQRMHLTEITQKLRKLSKVFIDSYIQTFLMYTHSGLHSAPHLTRTHAHTGTDGRRSVCLRKFFLRA